ncbi:hypothetical protein P9209_23685 [Prescottella defluvii]|nr:hypothetical protein P9209_23685 [Prescottella defluvii]
MSPTVSDVSAWNPDALKLTSEGIRGLASQLDDRMRELIAGQDSLCESWDGVAADSATKRISRENSTASLVAHALQQLAQEFESGAAVIGSARDHVISTVNGIRQRGFAVGEDGTVDASTLTVWLVMAPADTRDAARLRLEREAAELSLALLDALRQAESAASDVSRRVRESLSEVTSAGRDAVPGRIAESPDGEFSWAPDVPATVAASTIGVMVDATGEGLVSAAKASGDDVARLIGRRLGPFGAVLGAVPAIADDINGGMGPRRP